MKNKTKKIIFGSSFLLILGSAVTAGTVLGMQHHLKQNDKNYTKNNTSSNSTSPKIINSSPTNTNNNFQNFKIQNGNMSVNLKQNFYGLLNTGNNITVLLNKDGSATLQINLTTTKNISNITYNWYYTTTKPTNLSGSSLASEGTLVKQSDTLNTLNVTGSEIGDKVVYYYVIINFESDGYTFSNLASNLYILSAAGLSFSNQTINNNTLVPTAITQQQTANLSLNVENESSSITNYEQSWYSSNTDDFSSATAINDTNSTEMSSTNSYTVSSSNFSNSNLSFFYDVINFDYLGETFRIVSLPFVISYLNVTNQINGDDVANININELSNQTASLQLQINDSNSSIKITSYQWYNSSSETFTNNASILSGATSSSYEVNSQNLPLDSEEFYFEGISYSIGGYSFSVLAEPFYIINVGTTQSYTPLTQTIDITTQPQSSTILSGTSTQLSVNATLTNNTNSSNTLQYQWYEKNIQGVFVPISGATSSTYTVPESSTEADQNATLSFYVLISANGVSPVQSDVANLTIQFTTTQAKQNLSDYLQSYSNQESLLSSYFQSNQSNMQDLFTLVYGYEFKTIPNLQFESLQYVNATSSNNLPFSTWLLTAKTTSDGSYTSWNNDTNKWNSSTTDLPTGSIVEIELPFSLTGNQTFTNNKGVVITLSENITITNDATSISWTQSPNSSSGENANFSEFTFSILNNNQTIISTSYQYPNFSSITINNTNSNIPTYQIYSSSSADIQLNKTQESIVDLYNFVLNKF